MEKRQGFIAVGDLAEASIFFVIGVLLAMLTSLPGGGSGGSGREGLVQFGPADRFIIAGRAIWFYLGKTVWPVGLTFVYPKWDLQCGIGCCKWYWPLRLGATLIALGVAASLTIGARGGGGGVAVLPGRRCRALGVVNVYPMRFTFVADHYQYLAIVAVIVPASWSFGSAGTQMGGGIVLAAGNRDDVAMQHVSQFHCALDGDGGARMADRGWCMKISDRHIKPSGTTGGRRRNIE